MRQYTLCVYCHQSTRLRTSGRPYVIGTMWKHRRGDGLWCDGGGEYPPKEYDNPLTPKPGRAECPVCHKTVATRPRTGELYRHLDPHSGTICDGSGQAAKSDNDNTTTGLTGWAWGLNPADDLADLIDQYTPAETLTAWWRATAEDEIDMVVEKAIAYGATDLRDLGFQIMEMAGRHPANDDGYLTEVGIVFYAIGKLSRIVAAVKEGRRPNADSWLDLGVYARMAQRVHQHGGWPAV